jgi:hypothetical protein
MRTTIIPAQITTVEDKIAGNLNLTQILILMMPVFWITILFAFVPPVMRLVWYKLPLILIVLIICLILALRVKGRVVFNWLILLLKFKVRPAYFIFNKNDNYLREVEIPIKEKKQKVDVVKAIKTLVKKENELAQVESVKFLHIINDQKNSLSFKLSDKGGLNVAVEQIKK